MSGPAAILQAARDGDALAVEGLLSHDPGLVHASDESLKTPLHWAAEQDRRDVAERLLDAGADPEATTSWGATALDWQPPWGVRSWRICSWRAAPAEPDDHWVADSARMRGDVISNAFYGACRNGHTAVAAWLLERGAAINAKGVFGGTGLHWAAINGHEATVAFLVAHGADRTIRDARFDSTPEGWAAEGGHDKIRELLQRP